MSVLSELIHGVKKKPYQPLPVEDTYTPRYLAGIEASGKGAFKRINDTFDRAQGTNVGRLFSAGWGNSSLAGSYSLGNEDRRSQALLDLDNQLFAQRLGAQQAGTSAALQQFGINTQARQAHKNAQQAKSAANSALFGDLLSTGMKAAMAPATGGASMFMGGGRSTDPYAGLYNQGGQAPAYTPFMGFS